MGDNSFQTKRGLKMKNNETLTANAPPTETLKKIENVESDIFNTVKEKLGKAQDSVINIVKNALPDDPMETLEETGKEIAARTSKLAQSATNLIKRHPYQAITIGLGVGLFLGVYLRSSKNA